MSEKYRYAVAIHEASHAVADVRVGSSIDFVSIEFRKDEGSEPEEGRVQLLLNTNPLSLDDTLMVLFAGYAGEAVVIGAVDPKCAAHDFIAMDAECDKKGVFGDDRDRRTGQALKKAFAFFEDEFVEVMVREIADLLVKQTRIEGPVVHEIVGKYEAAVKLMCLKPPESKH